MEARTTAQPEAGTCLASAKHSHEVRVVGKGRGKGSQRRGEFRERIGWWGQITESLTCSRAVAGGWGEAVQSLIKGVEGSGYAFTRNSPVSL